MVQFCIVKTFTDEPWFQPGIEIAMWPGELEARVSKAKPIMLENK